MVGRMHGPPTIRERYPLPWAVEQTPGGFAITDAFGKRLAFLYAKSHASMDGLTAGEAKAIAVRLVAMVNEEAGSGEDGTVAPS